jgi:hypothetical protein
MGPTEAYNLYYNWLDWALPEQLPPLGDWTTWLLMGGRGAGKTMAGAQWVRALASEGVTPIALVGETLTEAMAVMVRGPSGILTICSDEERPEVVGSEVRWANGVVATVMAAADPERFRGPQFAAAWCDELEEITGETSGAKGFGAPQEEASERTIVGSFAVAFCEGEVTRLGRVWADGQVLETEGLTLRFYRGSEDQEADSLIEAVQGAGNAPAYRGLCYIVFERLPLSPFGNRIPNIAVELCRAVGELEPQIRSVNVIPGAGEFVYDPVPRVRLVSPGVTASENTHVSAQVSDWTVSIDELQAMCPNLETVSLVVAWFGDDLRCAHCTVAPRTEGVSRNVSGATWSVAGLTRAEAQVSSMHEGGLAYGGTPSDASVLAAIADLKARGLGVTLYPLMMMDIPADNPMGQPAYPWRGRISCDPAPGAVGSLDGTGTAAAQVAAFVPGYRDFILHYAGLAVAAGGVDAFIIGTEMKALNAVRGAGNTFPFVDALVELAADVRSVVGPECKLTYAADWSEATGYQPGGGAKFFHLDPLWASDDIDAVGIDNYMPVADWRDGTDHADAADWDSSYGLDYLRAGIAGGEGYDWYYADEADRLDGVRTPIADGAYDEPWVWRFKDLESWWLSEHHDRPGGVRSGTPTAWVPGGKQIWFTEIGCGAVDKGANQPSAFADPKSFENTRPFFSNGTPDALMQRQFLRAQFSYWASDANPVNGDSMPMVAVDRITPWAWDARPFPAFPTQREAWSDWPNYATGHWLNGRLGALASDELVRAIAADYGVDVADADAAGPVITGLSVDGVVSARDAMAPVLSASGLSVRDDAEGLVFARTSARAPLEVSDVAVADGPLAARTRPDPSEAVGQVALGYFDRERGYLAASVTAMTLAGGAAAAERSALVLDPPAARRAAERMLIDQASQRDTLEFALPHSALALEVGDAVTLAGQGDGPFEVTAIRDGEVRKISARAIPPVLEAAIVSDAPRAAAIEPPARALPLMLAAHLPAEAGGSASRLLLAASASPWPGRVIFNDEATGANVGRLDRNAVVGVLTEPLVPGPLATWDMANAATVNLRSGHLASMDDAVVLAGGNRIAVETEAGWEIIGFAAAELVSPGTYRLTRLLRAQGGTDFAMTGAGEDASVIVLDGRPLAADVPAGWLGETIALRAYAGAGDPDGSLFGADLGLGPILPLAPVHLRAVRTVGGDVTLSWTRRSRADTDSWAAMDAPLDNVPEAYRVTIFDGLDPVREITAGSPSATYAAVEQTADFGGFPDSFGFSVSQVSPVYGPGHEALGAFDG